MSNDGKPRRRQAGKPDPQKDGEKPETVKVTLTLPAELAKRFGVHAAMKGLSKSELFAELVRQGCRRFVVHDHERAADSGQAEAGAA